MAQIRPQLAIDEEFVERLKALVPQSAHLKLNDLLREALSRGVASLELELLGAENKRLLNQKMKQRQGDMAKALEIVKNGVKFGEASDAEMLEAIAVMEKGLSD